MTIPFPAVSLPRLADEFATLENLGYTDLWSSEVSGADAFTPLVMAAGATRSVHLGTAIVSVFTRGPAVLAQSAAALAELAPGRVTLGIGTSSEAIVQGWNGVEFADPYRRTRDVTRFLRAALAGEKLTHDFSTFSVSKFTLSRPPSTPPRLAIAALRPGMLRLAARESDAAILNWLSADDVPRVAAEVRSGADGVAKDLVARIFVCPTIDAAEARSIGKRMIAGYLTVPAYAEFQRWLGREELLQPMWTAWSEGRRREAADLVPEQLVDDLLIHGPAEYCRERVQAYVEAGVTVPVLSIMGGTDDVLRTCRELAPR